MLKQALTGQLLSVLQSVQLDFQLRFIIDALTTRLLLQVTMFCL